MRAAAIMDFGPKPLFPVRGKVGNFLWMFRTSCGSIITKNSIVNSHVQVPCNTYWTIRAFHYFGCDKKGGGLKPKMTKSNME